MRSIRVENELCVPQSRAGNDFHLKEKLDRQSAGDCAFRERHAGRKWDFGWVSRNQAHDESGDREYLRRYTRQSSRSTMVNDDRVILSFSFFFHRHDWYSRVNSREGNYGHSCILGMNDFWKKKIKEEDCTSPICITDWNFVQLISRI